MDRYSISLEIIKSFTRYQTQIDSNFKYIDFFRIMGSLSKSQNEADYFSGYSIIMISYDSKLWRQTTIDFESRLCDFSKTYNLEISHRIEVDSISRISGFLGKQKILSIGGVVYFMGFMISQIFK